MDVIALLKDDHRRLVRLLREIENTLSASERRTLFDQMASDLRRHHMAEEKMLYPALKADATGRDIVIEAHETHLITARLVRELEETPLTDERWVAKLKVLAEILSRHIKDEHRTIFPKIKAVLDRQERDLIGTRVAELACAGARG